MIKSIAAKEINQITSGQVIIDVKSIIKEFIENSIDANATNIEIIFTNYGVDQISVQDNGSGILTDDFDSLCLRSHTSKLSQFEDLSSLNTLGFRGEALNSICSLCSKVKVITIPTTTDSSYNKVFTLEYDCMGILKTKNHKPTRQETGTTIIAEKLFHNLPVRYKNFVKNSRKEFHKAINFIVNYILMFSQIKFTVVNIVNGKKTVMLSSKGGENTTLLDNVITIFGNETAKGLIPIDVPVNDDIRITGFISNHSIGYGGKTSIDRQFLFINKRPIYMKRFNRVLNETYKLYNNTQYPVFILNIIVNTNILDVNLTPDKTTVLIHDEAKVLEEIRGCITQFYESQNNIFIPKNQIKIVQISLSLEQETREPSTSSDIKCDTKSSDVYINTGVDDSEPYSDLENLDQSRVAENLDIDVNTGELFVRDDSDTEMVSSVSKENTIHKVINKTITLNDTKIITEVVLNMENDCHHQNIDEDNNDSEVNFLRQNHFVINHINPPNSLESLEISDDGEPSKSDIAILDTLLASQTNHSIGSGKQEVGRRSQPRFSNKTQSKLDIRQISNTFKNDFNESISSERNDYYGENFHPAVDDDVQIEIGNQEWWQPSVKRLKREELHKLKLPLHIDSSEFEIKLNYSDSKNNEVKLQVDDISKAKEQEETLSFIISKQDFLKMKIIGQFNLGFILVSLTRGETTNLFIIDQHASDEKYNFERLSDDFEINQQQLITPKTIELSIVEEVLVIDNQKTFHQNGFRFEVDEAAPPGKRIKLTSLPNLKGKIFDMDDFNELINIVSTNSNSFTNAKCSKIRAICAMKACRSLIMIGQALTRSTMEQIVRHLASLSKPWNCPHGRPTMRHLAELNDWKTSNYHDYQL